MSITRPNDPSLVFNCQNWDGLQLRKLSINVKYVKYQVTLAYRSCNHRLCTCTDTSDLLLPDVVKKVSLEKFSEHQEYHKHQLLAFLSGHLSESQVEWVILQKEASKLMETAERIH